MSARPTILQMDLSTIGGGEPTISQLYTNKLIHVPYYGKFSGDDIIS